MIRSPEFTRGRIYLLRLIGLLIGLLILGALGYMLIEHWCFRESLYMAVITLTTVGFGEVEQLSPWGHWFTMIYILVGVVLAGYSISALTAHLTSGSVRDYMRGRKMTNDIQKLTDFTILCGYGKTGVEIAREFRDASVNLVIIDQDQERLDSAVADGFLALIGNANSEETLLKAGVDRARGLITTLPTDSDNLYVVLTARDLNSDLFIISRTIEPHADKRLLKAGANKVVSPSLIGGRRMAIMMLQPAVTDFLDTFMSAGGTEFRLTQLSVPPGCSFSGQPLGKTNIRGKTEGLLIMAVKPVSGGQLVLPTADTVVNTDDQLVVLGTERQVGLLMDMMYQKA